MQGMPGGKRAKHARYDILIYRTLDADPLCSENKDTFYTNFQSKRSLYRRVGWLPNTQPRPTGTIIHRCQQVEHKTSQACAYIHKTHSYAKAVLGSLTQRQNQQEEIMQDARKNMPAGVTPPSTHVKTCRLASHRFRFKSEERADTSLPPPKKKKENTFKSNQNLAPFAATTKNKNEKLTHDAGQRKTSCHDHRQGDSRNEGSALAKEGDDALGLCGVAIKSGMSSARPNEREKRTATWGGVEGHREKGGAVSEGNSERGWDGGGGKQRGVGGPGGVYSVGGGV